MRTIIIAAGIPLMLVSFLYAFNVGTKKDFLTGLSTKNNGLGYSEANLSADGKKMTSNKASLGSKIVLQYTEVDGFTEKKGKAFPGLYMHLADKKGNTIAEFKDLLSEYTDKGLSPDVAATLSATLNTGKPMEKNAEYKWKVRVWDKKGKGEIISEMILKMK